MGKAKKSKARSRRKNVAAGFPCEENQKPEIQIENKTINKDEVMAGLNSLELSTREGTVGLLASIFGSADLGMDDARALGYHKLVKGGVTKRLIKCLFDVAETVRELAMVAVRNMCSCGQPNVIKQLISDDILTPLLKHLEELAGSNVAGKERYKQTMVNQILGSLNSLLDFSEPMVSRFTQRNGTLLVMQLLRPPHQDLDNVILAAQTLHVASDSNLAMAQQLQATEGAVDLLTQIAQSEALPQLCRLYATGVLVNVQQLLGDSNSMAQLLAMALPQIQAALVYDHANTVQCCVAIHEVEAALLSQLEAQKAQPKQKDGSENQETKAGDSFEEQKDQMLKTWGNQAAPLKLSLELLANLCSEGSEDDEEKEWESDEEAAMDQIASFGIEAAQKDSPVAIMLSSPEVFAQVMAVLEALCAPLADLPPSTAKYIADDLLTLRHVVSCCASNMICSLSLPALGNIENLWQGLRQLIQRGMEEMPQLAQGLLRETINASGTAPDLWYQSLTATMVVLLKRFGRELMAGGKITDEAVGTLIQLCQWPGGHEVRINGMVCLGVLGSCPHTDEQNLVFAQALLHGLRDSHLLVQAEAMNAIMDIYADVDHDQPFEASGLLLAITQIIPDFKAKIKQDGQTLGREEFLFLKEMNLNIRRFQKYKESGGNT